MLGHEIGHVAHKHTVNAIRKNKAVQLGTDAALSDRGPFLDQLAEQGVRDGARERFDRGDEIDADKAAVQLTQKAGYAPATLADFLTRLDERNKDQPERNGLFASHPETKERIDKIRQLGRREARRDRRGALQDATSSTQPTPITAIAAVDEGAAGLTGSTAPAAGRATRSEQRQEGKSRRRKASASAA